MDPAIFTEVTQFGLAGLVAWMWLTERRASAQREAQLGEAHERLMEQRVQLDALMRLVGENTRALASLESSQRSLSQIIERVLGAGGAHRDAA